MIILKGKFQGWLRDGNRTFFGFPDPEPKIVGMSFDRPETVPITDFTEISVSRTRRQVPVGIEPPESEIKPANFHIPNNKNDPLIPNFRRANNIYDQKKKKKSQQPHQKQYASLNYNNNSSPAQFQFQSSSAEPPILFTTGGVAFPHHGRSH